MAPETLSATDLAAKTDLCAIGNGDQHPGSGLRHRHLAWRCAPPAGKGKDFERYRRHDFGPAGRRGLAKGGLEE
jgi:hypothetical protein